ncbi:hypothetical protein [Rhizobium sp. Root1220]|uniref:hypothetical protein n=1 Tax=Rhizobium sp. Root1220 TaxID=1736432 RepID=UPI0006F6858F|nr:hypothetical protein [Rhizobium sp. Root1220]KQV79629.1 hypothetical protein ASC90_26300 [Rhizobium sp. Root1220]
MAFIQATWAKTELPVHINIDHIVAVSQADDHTKIYLSTTSEGGKPVGVKEKANDIMELIDTAQALVKRRAARAVA